MDDIVLPDHIRPADIVGPSDILPGQEWMNKAAVLAYARQMQRGEFPWVEMHDEQPMAVEVGINGKVITQGHHRWLAAKLAKVEIPIPIETRYDLLDAGLPVPFAKSWDQVKWE